MENTKQNEVSSDDIHPGLHYLTQRKPFQVIMKGKYSECVQKRGSHEDWYIYDQISCYRQFLSVYADDNNNLKQAIYDVKKRLRIISDAVSEQPIVKLLLDDTVNILDKAVMDSIWDSLQSQL